MVAVFYAQAQERRVAWPQSMRVLLSNLNGILYLILRSDHMAAAMVATKVV